MRLRLVQLHVPVEVIAPTVRRVTESYRYPDGRCALGTLRDADEVHTGFGGRPPAFLAVARDAAGDDVLPILPAALGDRHHMIERQLRGRKHLSAVLTGMVVTRVDVGAGERDVIDIPLDLDVAEEPDDGRDSS